MKKFIKNFLIELIKIYQKIISPLLPATCRFTPTCSEYCKSCLIKHGLFKGFLLSIKRVIKCHPWGQSGFDPVP